MHASFTSSFSGIWQCKTYLTLNVCFQVKLITSVEDQKRILQSCHSDSTSGHFGVTKTRRRLAERFYWKGMYQDVKKLVRLLGLW